MQKLHEQAKTCENLSKNFSGKNTREPQQELSGKNTSARTFGKKHLRTSARTFGTSSCMLARRIHSAGPLPSGRGAGQMQWVHHSIKREETSCICTSWEPLTFKVEGTLKKMTTVLWVDFLGERPRMPAFPGFSNPL